MGKIWRYGYAIFSFCNYFISFSATRKVIYMQWTERQAILKLMAARTLEVMKVKISRSRSGVAQRVCRGIALLFHDRGTRRGWVVSSTPRPHFTPGKDPVPILQDPWWAPEQVWTGGKSRHHRDSISDHPSRSQSLYQLSYPAHILQVIINWIHQDRFLILSWTDYY